MVLPVSIIPFQSINHYFSPFESSLNPVYLLTFKSGKFFFVHGSTGLGKLTIALRVAFSRQMLDLAHEIPDTAHGFVLYICPVGKSVDDVYTKFICRRIVRGRWTQQDFRQNEWYYAGWNLPDVRKFLSTQSIWSTRDTSKECQSRMLRTGDTTLLITTTSMASRLLKSKRLQPEQVRLIIFDEADSHFFGLPGINTRQDIPVRIDDNGTFPYWWITIYLAKSPVVLMSATDGRGDGCSMWSYLNLAESNVSRSIYADNLRDGMSPTQRWVLISRANNNVRSADTNNTARLVDYIPGEHVANTIVMGRSERRKFCLNFDNIRPYIRNMMAHFYDARDRIHDAYAIFTGLIIKIPDNLPKRGPDAQSRIHPLVLDLEDYFCERGVTFWNLATEQCNLDTAKRRIPNKWINDFKRDGERFADQLLSDGTVHVLLVKKMLNRSSSLPHLKFVSFCCEMNPNGPEWEQFIGRISRALRQWHLPGDKQDPGQAPTSPLDIESTIFQLGPFTHLGRTRRYLEENYDPLSRPAVEEVSEVDPYLSACSESEGSGNDLDAFTDTDSDPESVENVSDTDSCKEFDGDEHLENSSDTDSCKEFDGDEPLENSSDTDSCKELDGDEHLENSSDTDSCKELDGDERLENWSDTDSCQEFDGDERLENLTDVQSCQEFENDSDNLSAADSCQEIDDGDHLENSVDVEEDTEFDADEHLENLSDGGSCRDLDSDSEHLENLGDVDSRQEFDDGEHLENLSDQEIDGSEHLENTIAVEEDAEFDDGKHLENLSDQEIDAGEHLENLSDGGEDTEFDDREHLENLSDVGEDTEFDSDPEHLEDLNDEGNAHLVNLSDTHSCDENDKDQRQDRETLRFSDEQDGSRTETSDETAPISSVAGDEDASSLKVSIPDPWIPTLPDVGEETPMQLIEPDQEPLTLIQQFLSASLTNQLPTPLFGRSTHWTPYSLEHHHLEPVAILTTVTCALDAQHTPAISVSVADYAGDKHPRPPVTQHPASQRYYIQTHEAEYRFIPLRVWLPSRGRLALVVAEEQPLDYIKPNGVAALLGLWTNRPTSVPTSNPWENPAVLCEMIAANICDTLLTVKEQENPWLAFRALCRGPEGALPSFIEALWKNGFDYIAHTDFADGRRVRAAIDAVLAITEMLGQVLYKRGFPDADTRRRLLFSDGPNGTITLRAILVAALHTAQVPAHFAEIHSYKPVVLGPIRNRETPSTVPVVPHANKSADVVGTEIQVKQGRTRVILTPTPTTTIGKSFSLAAGLTRPSQKWKLKPPPSADQQLQSYKRSRAYGSRTVPQFMPARRADLPLYIAVAESSHIDLICGKRLSTTLFLTLEPDRKYSLPEIRAIINLHSSCPVTVITLQQTWQSMRQSLDIVPPPPLPYLEITSNNALLLHQDTHTERYGTWERFESSMRTQIRKPLEQQAGYMNYIRLTATDPTRLWTSDDFQSAGLNPKPRYTFYGANDHFYVLQRERGTYRLRNKVNRLYLLLIGT